MLNPLIADSKNLSALSLQAYLSDLYSQGDNINFSQMLRHPHIGSIGPNHLELLSIFIEASYPSYLAKPQLPALAPAQHRTLRKLTVLKAVTGLKTIPIRKLQSLLALPEDEVLSLLLEMAITSQIQIRIDQPQGQIQLLSSEPLASSTPSPKTLIAGLDRTLSHNLSISRTLTHTCKLID